MQIHPQTIDAYNLLHEGTLALARAEQQGICVDVNYLEQQKELLTQQIADLESKFMRSKLYLHWQHSMKSKVNINSNAQLAAFLYKIKKIKPAKTTVTGQGATDEEALQQLNMPELNDLIEVRKLKKIRDTYLDSFAREQVNGVIHPHFNLHLVKTFRSSANSPNFQNIPKRDEQAKTITRGALFPRKGHQLVEIDYSGLEVKIAATYHKDPVMLKYIHNPDSDMHGDMAKQIFLLDKFNKKTHNVLRQAAKNGFVFPEFYGDYYGNCARHLACTWCQLPESRWQSGQGIEINGSTISDHLISKGIKSFDKFKKHIQDVEEDFWGNRFKVYASWKEKWWRMYQRNGYVDLHTGFRCSGVMGKNDAINYPVQGAAFHCLLWSFIQIDKIMQEQNWDTRLIGQIHDSIVLDASPDELEHVIKTVREITCVELPKAWTWINVPLDVDVDIYPVDNSWATKPN